MRNSTAFWTVIAIALFVLLISGSHQAQAGYMGRRLKWEAPSFSRWTHDHKTGMLYWTTYSQDLFRLDTNTDSLIKLTNFTSISPNAICMGEDSETLFILTSTPYPEYKKEVFKYNLRTEQLDLIIGAGYINESYYLAYHDHMLYISDEGAQKIIKAPTTGGPITEVASGLEFKSIDVDSEGNIFFVESKMGPNYSSNVLLKMIPASSPSTIRTLDKSGGNYVLYIDKYRTPNEVYYTTTSGQITRLKLENGNAVIEGPLVPGSVLIRTPWLSSPFFQKNYQDLHQLAVTETGNIWFPRTIYPENMLIVLEYTPDSTLTLMWIFMISVIVIVAISPCFTIGCATIAFDVILIVVDLIRSHFSANSRDESANRLVAGLDSSNSMPLSTEQTSKQQSSKPTSYILLSAARNSYFFVCSILFALVAYVFLYLPISGAWSQQDCTGSMCGLGRAIITFLSAIGVSAALGWLGMFWSPIYFVSSFIRKDPYTMDLIMCFVNIISYVVLILTVVVVVAIIQYEYLLLMIFMLPVLGVYIPAIILDVCFILLLIQIRTDRAHSPSIPVQVAILEVQETL